MQQVTITIRSAVPEDAEGIARIYIESAEYHASLDPGRYSVPSIDAVVARYREHRQHPSQVAGQSITLVANSGDEIVGFIDARLEQSSDAMHRDIIYCSFSEIAVSSRHRNQGIGEQLLQAAEDWACRHGATFGSLEYLAANTRAGAFYQQRMGYRIAHITAIKRL